MSLKDELLETAKKNEAKTKRLPFRNRGQFFVFEILLKEIWAK